MEQQPNAPRSVFHDLCLLLLLGALKDPTLYFHSITANIICSIVFGERFDYKDPRFLRLLDLFYQTFSLISSLSSQVRGRRREGGHEGTARAAEGDICTGGPKNAALGWRKGGDNRREGFRDL